ncbi:hypothetical protein J41TS2_49000 [Bacillus sonorensis]|nr:hypothetical protein J41TS2_49000 [Bacillus sonorensis]
MAFYTFSFQTLFFRNFSCFLKGRHEGVIGSIPDVELKVWRAELKNRQKRVF